MATSIYKRNIQNLITETLGDKAKYKLYNGKKIGDIIELKEILVPNYKPDKDIYKFNKSDVNADKINLSNKSNYNLNDFIFYYDNTYIDAIIKEYLNETYYDSNYKNKTNLNIYKAVNKINTNNFTFKKDFSEFKNIFLSDDNYDKLIHLILLSKIPKGFAENKYEVANKFTNIDFHILGNIQTLIKNVTCYDDARYGLQDKIFDEPFLCHMIILSAPILFSWQLDNDVNFTLGDYNIMKCKSFIETPPDKQEAFDFYEYYFNIIKIKLLPTFKMIDENAKLENKKAFIIMPGIGLGEFLGSMESENNKRFVVDSLIYSIYKLLKTFDFHHIALFRLDLSSGKKEKQLHSFNNVEMQHTFSEQIKDVNAAEFTRVSGNEVKDKVKVCNENTNTKIIIDSVNINGYYTLIKPNEYWDELNKHLLYRIVAGDAISYPGNDMWVNSKATDEGLIGGSTNIMSKVCNQNIIYGSDRKSDQYRLAGQPFKKKSHTWSNDDKLYKYSALHRNLGKINIRKFGQYDISFITNILTKKTKESKNEYKIDTTKKYMDISSIEELDLGYKIEKYKLVYDILSPNTKSLRQHINPYEYNNIKPDFISDSIGADFFFNILNTMLTIYKSIDIKEKKSNDYDKDKDPRKYESRYNNLSNELFELVIRQNEHDSSQSIYQIEYYYFDISEVRFISEENPGKWNEPINNLNINILNMFSILNKIIKLYLLSKFNSNILFNKTILKYYEFIPNYYIFKTEIKSHIENKIIISILTCESTDFNSSDKYHEFIVELKLIDTINNKNLEYYFKRSIDKITIENKSFFGPNGLTNCVIAKISLEYLESLGLGYINKENKNKIMFDCNSLNNDYQLVNFIRGLYLGEDKLTMKKILEKEMKKHLKDDYDNMISQDVKKPKYFINGSQSDIIFNNDNRKNYHKSGRVLWLDYYFDKNKKIDNFRSGNSLTWPFHYGYCEPIFYSGRRNQSYYSLNDCEEVVSSVNIFKIRDDYNNYSTVKSDSSSPYHCNPKAQLCGRLDYTFKQTSYPDCYLYRPEIKENDCKITPIFSLQITNKYSENIKKDYIEDKIYVQMHGKPKDKYDKTTFGAMYIYDIFILSINHPEINIFLNNLNTELYYYKINKKIENKFVKNYEVEDKNNTWRKCPPTRGGLPNEYNRLVDIKITNNQEVESSKFLFNIAINIKCSSDDKQYTQITLEKLNHDNLQELLHFID